MPAGEKMSIASMKAEPMMPNMSVTPLETMVSTKASEGVIRVGPLGTLRGSRSLMVIVSCRLSILSSEKRNNMFQKRSMNAL